MSTDGADAKAPDAYHHGDLRQALIDAALAKVDQVGPDAISLAALAKTLGVSQAAPYRHFPDRDALLAAVAAQGFKAFTAALTAAAAASSRRSALSRMGHAYVAFGLARPGLYRLMFASHILARAAAGDELKAVAKGSFDLLVNALPPSRIPQGRKRRALKIWVALHGVVMLANQNLLLDQPAGPGIGLDELVEDIIA